MEFYPLAVTAVDRSTENTVSLSFEPGEDLRPLFEYQAGQFLTLRLKVDGEILQRAYSLNSSPGHRNPLQITVRAVEGGRVSRWLNRHVQRGDLLEVAPPMGTFCPDISPANHRSYFLFAAGSGITPLLSIARTVLAVEPWSYIYLLYGSRDENNIVLRQQVDELAEQHPDRVTLVHTLSQPISGKWSALWKNVEHWRGETGRVTPARVQDFIQQHPPAAQDTRYLICGPSEMIASTQLALEMLDVDPDHIMSERFTTTQATGTDNPIASQLTINSSTICNLEPGETLLQSMMREKLEPPYSCQSGVCGACTATLKKGNVTMANPAALSEAEIKEGSVLLCQARAQTSQLEIEI